MVRYQNYGKFSELYDAAKSNKPVARAAPCARPAPGTDYEQEKAGAKLKTMILPPAATLIEPLISNGVEWLRLIIETFGVVIVGVGFCRAITILLKFRTTAGFNLVRLELATYLALALEFQLAADILSTAIAPTWDKIGKLGAIAIIRTALNFFLMREIEIEKEASGEHPLKPPKSEQEAE